MIPETLLSFEDVKRKFVRVRALAMQQLGFSDTDKTATFGSFTPAARDGLVDLGLGAREGVLPNFVEFLPTGAARNQGHEVKVEIIPARDIPAYEGAFVIAFYGDPLRYRLGFDSWNRGTLYLHYDPVEDWTAIAGTTAPNFPQNFEIMLENKSALLLIDTLRFKMAFKLPEEIADRIQLIDKALDRLQQTKAAELAEWEKEFKLWKNTELNEQPHMRRTNDEIGNRGYGNVTRNNALDFVG